MAPRSSNRSVYLPDTVWASLQSLADARGVSLNGAVLELLRVGLECEGRDVPPIGAKPRVPEKTRTAPPSLTLPRAVPGSRLKKGRGG